MTTADEIQVRNIAIMDYFKDQGFANVTDSDGNFWRRELSDGTGLAVMFAADDVPTALFGPPDSWDWYVAHMDVNNGDELGGGNCSLELGREWIADYIREPGWDRGSRTLFNRIGVALYGAGNGWTKRMEPEVKVRARTLRRYAIGRDVPDGIMADVRALMVKRRDELAKLLTEMGG